MDKVELILFDDLGAGFASLDLSGEFDIALQYSIGDIKDITKRNSSYSKTIVLPGTKNNNFWLGNLYDINSDFSKFNPNKKTNARVLVNSEPVINGFIQLRNIRVLRNNNQNGGKIEYDVVIYDNKIDLITELGEKTLRDLDLSRFNHTYDRSNIISSWGHTWEDGYVYPMYGSRDKSSLYETTDFYPAVFNKIILDEIIKDAGYGWTGSFLEDEQFEKEIIPFTTDGGLVVDPRSELVKREFYAGVTGSVSFTASTPIQNPQLTIGNIVFPYNDVTTPPNFDRSGDYDVISYEWEATNSGNFIFEYELNYSAAIKNTNVFDVFSVDAFNNGVIPTIISQAHVEVFNGVVWVPINGSETVVTKAANEAVTQRAQNEEWTFDFQQTIKSDEVQLFIGDKARVVVRFIKPANLRFTAVGFVIPFTTFTADKFGGFFRNIPLGSKIGVGDTIALSSILNENIKQRDLISDIIKRYNVYIETDKDNSRLLIFKTRNDFYTGGAELDWTDKKDYSVEDKIELLSELQFKEMIFTYKSDNDEFNNFYTERTGEIYGQQKVIFDNDFVKGQNKIESIFSPTPLINNAWGAVIPGIDNKEPSGNPRVLYWGGIKSNKLWFFSTRNNILVFNILPRIGYPYAGHFDDPDRPTLDINFGELKQPMFINNDRNTNVTTSNNMFNRYWANYISQIDEGKLVTMRLYLNERDIRFIKDNFNSKIFIDGNYYYVNKVKDYKPLNKSTTEVEFIKINDNFTPKPTFLRNNNGALIGPSRDLVFGENNFGIGGNFIGGDGVVYSNRQLVLGNNNFLQGSTLILGDSNEVDDMSLVIGNNNKLSGKNTAIDSNNNIIDNEDITLIGVEGLTQSIGGSIYLGNCVRVDKDECSISLDLIRFNERLKPFRGRIEYMNFFDLGDAGIQPPTTNLTIGVWAILETIPTLKKVNGDLTLGANGLITYSGPFETTFKCEAILSGSSGNNNEIHAAFFKNNNLVACSEQSLVTSAAGRASNLPFQCVIDLEDGDTLQIYVKNTTSGSSFVLSNLNVILTEIDSI